MAFGLAVLLSCLALFSTSEARRVFEHGHDDVPAEELAAKMAKYEWDRQVIWKSHHDNEIYKELAPPGDDHGKIDVGVRMDLIRIDGIDLEHGVLDTVAHLHLKWQDSRWDWHDHHDVQRIVVPKNDLWEPDVVVLNSDAQDGHHTVMYEDLRVVVMHDGTVLFTEPLHIHSTCDGLHESYSDGDQVTCHIKIGSWSYADDRLDYHLDDGGIVDHTNEHENNHWSVISVSAEVEHEDLENMGEFADVNFTLHLQYHS